MVSPNPISKDQNASELIKTTPDFNPMIRITFWNGLGFIFFMFIKSYVVIYFFGGSGVTLGIIMALQPFARLISMPLILFGLGTACQGLLVGFFWPPFYSLISEKSFKGNRTQALATGRGKMIGYGFLIGAFISIPIFALVSIFLPENIPLMYSPLLLFAIINFFAGIRFNKKVDETLTFEIYCASLINNDSRENNLTETCELDDINTPEVEQILDATVKLDNIKDEDKEGKKEHKIFNIGFAALILALLMTSINGTIYSPFVSAYLIENLLNNISVTIMPIIVMIVYFPAQVISQLAASRLGKSFDRTTPLITVIIIGLFKSLMIWFLIIAFSAFDFAIILIFLYIAAESNVYLIQAIMSRISIKHRGKIFGLNMWIDRLGRVIGPIIGGILWDTMEDTVPFVVSIYIGLCLIPLYVFAIRELRPYMVEQVEIDKLGIMSIKNKNN
ncbi:MAG: MFS transporter [Promethearchaeota archaeon]